MEPWILITFLKLALQMDWYQKYFK